MPSNGGPQTISFLSARRCDKTRQTESLFRVQTATYWNWKSRSPTSGLRYPVSIQSVTWWCGPSNSRGKMKRTFNYTGRRKIGRKDVSITLRQEKSTWVFDAELRLADYHFPRNAEIWVEAHRQNLWMQWA